MNGYDLNLAFQYVDDRYLDIAEQERMTRGRRSLDRNGRRADSGRVGWRLAPLAACIVALLLALAFPAAAIAGNWFGLRDLLLPPVSEERIENEERDVPEQGTSGREDSGQDTLQMISLAGYQNSPEARAQAEWHEIYAKYVADGPFDEHDAQVDSRYQEYAVYNQAMAEDFEKIIQKYGLKLYRELNVVDPEELAYRVGGEFTGEELKRYWAYIYDNGTFQFDGDMVLDDGSLLGIQLRRTVKGTFDEVMLGIGNIDDYREIPYRAACGEQVTLALSGHKSLLFADFEECFVLVNVLQGTDSGVTEDILKTMADSIDFGILKNVQAPDMRGDSIPPKYDNPWHLSSFGECGNLGLGWLVYAEPKTAQEDYKIYFFASKDENDRYKRLEELDFDLERADFVFPDVREGNSLEGEFGTEFGGMYFDESFVTADGKAGMLFASSYFKGDEMFSDFRVYRECESGYGYEPYPAAMQEIKRRHYDSNSLQDAQKQYAVATNIPGWEVELFAKSVREQILGGDLEGFSERISYPVTIAGTVYADREAFLRSPFAARPPQEFLEALKAETCEDMFANYQGVLLGAGELWIGEILGENGSSAGLKVIAINAMEN